MKVDILEIEKVLRWFGEINRTDLEDIVWMRGDEQLNPTQEQLDEYAFIGLSNRDFPSCVGWMPDGVGIRVTTLVVTKTKELMP